MKRLIALVLSVVLCLAMGLTVFAADTDAEQTESVKYLTKIGILNDAGEGEFDQSAVITRAEAAKLICFLMEAHWAPIPRLQTPPELTEQEVVEFTDLAADNWAAPFVSYCVEKGILAADESGAFLPEEPVTVEDFCKAVQTALGTEDASLLDHVETDPAEACTGTDAAEILMNALFFGPSYTETIGYTNFSLVARPDIYDMPYLDDGNPRHTLDVFYPDGDAPEGGWPVVIFAHGGGFARNDKVSNDIEAFTRIVDYGYVSICINYSDAVDAALPYEILEGKAAVRFVRANADLLKINPDQIFAAGGSAGAIVMQVVGAAGDDPAFKEMVDEMGAPDVSDAVRGTILFYTSADYNTMWGHKAWQAGTLSEYDPELAAEYDEKYAEYAKYNEFFEGTDPGPQDLTAENPQIGGSLENAQDVVQMISPANYLNENTPPFFLVHGTADVVLSFLQSVDFAEALTKAGVPVEFRLIEGLGHGVQFIEEVPTTVFIDWMNQILEAE